MLVIPDRKDLTPTWQDFNSAVPARLTLPVYEFVYSLQYVPVQLEPAHRRYAQNIVVDAVVEALEAEPDKSLTSLSVMPNSDEPGADGTYFSISYTSPVYDFLIQMGPTGFAMIKRSSTLQDLLLTSRIFVAISHYLFLGQPADDGTEARILPFPQAGIDIRPVRISFAWEHHLVLGTHLGNESEANNGELLTRMLRLGDGDTAAPRPLAALDSGSVRRGDVSLGFTKELEGRARQLWISYEGPWNVTRKDVDVRTVYRLGESDAPMEALDLADFRTPFVAFFRDEVLNGFFADLFGAVNVEGRMN